MGRTVRTSTPARLKVKGMRATMSLIFLSLRVSFYCLCRMCPLVHDLFSKVRYTTSQFLPKLVTHIPWLERVNPCIIRLSLVSLEIVL